MFSSILGTISSKLLNNSNPAALAQTLNLCNWYSFFADTSLDDLETFNAALDNVKDALRETIAAKARQLEELPECAQLLCDSIVGDDATHEKRIVDTVKYVVEILPCAHVSARLKSNVRRILGAGSYFTTNLGWARQWDTLRAQCKKSLMALGLPLELLFKQENLRDRLGCYTPPLSSMSVADTNSHTATATNDGHSTDTTTALQLIPSQCSGDQFQEDAYLTNLELECVYLHFLRMLALAINGAFQSKVQDVLTSAEIQHTFSAAEVKSYERMYTKMMSWSDHAQLPRPRPAHNLDVIRCLVMFESAGDMRRAFDAVPHAFTGTTYSKFKNGMSLSEKEVEEAYYLRLVLGSGKFEFSGHQTIGELRSDPEVQKVWRRYVDTSTVPPFVSPQKWHQQATLAQSWLNDLPKDTPVYVHGEVQMVLRRYKLTRDRMHESYKIIRAVDPAALNQDYARHKVSWEAGERFRKDGDSELNCACRDGTEGALPRLLSTATASVIGRGIEIASRYGHRGCVARLLSKAKEMGLTVASHAPQALVAAAKGDGRRAPRRNFDVATAESGWFDLEDNKRCSIAQMLLDHGVNVNSSDIGSKTALYWAAARSYSNLVQLLITRHADVNLATKNKDTPLHFAGNGAIVRLLCKAGADVNNADNRLGSSPLDVHAERWLLEPVQMLIECRANVHQTRPDGSSALYGASENGDAAVVRVLLDARAQVDQRNKNGASPLAAACQYGHPEVAGMLVDANADVKNVFGGWSAVAYAKRCGHQAVADVILDRIKKKKK